MANNLRALAERALGDHGITLCSVIAPKVEVRTSVSALRGRSIPLFFS